MPILADIPNLGLNSVTGIGSALVLFFAFSIGHALGDFPLQGDFLARGKNRRLPSPILADSDHSHKRVWIFCLTYHALIHAGLVWIITGSVLIGIIELVVHWIIDALKAENLFSFETDQWLHLATKAIYVVLIWAEVLS